MTDIILEIFQHVDSQSSIAPALVHRAWLELFLNKIWRKLTTLDGVFCVLGSKQKDARTGNNVSHFYVRSHRY
jgi:hypothetical protein